MLDRLARHTCSAPWRGSHVGLRLHLPAAHTSSLQAPPQPEVNTTQVSLWIHLPTIQVRHAGWHWVLCTLHYTFNHAWTVFTTVCELLMTSPCKCSSQLLVNSIAEANTCALTMSCSATAYLCLQNDVAHSVCIYGVNLLAEEGFGSGTALC